jgi:hypothetical protein
MNLQKVIKQLQRELKANRQKAAVLGVLAVVALYFWWPLVAKWFGNGSTATAASTSPTVVNPATLAITPPAAAKKSTVAWQEVARALERDPRMKPTAWDEDRDPFASLAPPTQVVETDPTEAELAKKKSPVVTPESAGLVVTGTAISRGRRTALISGRTFALGDKILINETVSFEIVAITDSSVVLQSDAKRYSLKISRPPVSARIDFRAAP